MGVVNIIMGVGVMGLMFVCYFDVDKVVFIGLIGVGCDIVCVVVGMKKKFMFELGGKVVNIVFDDVLID